MNRDFHELCSVRKQGFPRVMFSEILQFFYANGLWSRMKNSNIKLNSQGFFWHTDANCFNKLDSCRPCYDSDDYDDDAILCGMVGQRKTSNLFPISSISRGLYHSKPQTREQPEWSGAVVITSRPSHTLWVVEMDYIFLYKQVESGLSPHRCLYFQGF